MSDDAPQHTSCVSPSDYQYPDIPRGDAGLPASIWGLITNGGIGLLQAVCDYMLHGKLVCLPGGDHCAIGRVVGFETVDDKSGLDKIDNDFSINILLAPHGLSEFTSGTLEDGYQRIIKDGIQGNLMKEQPGMPVPHESDDGSRYHTTNVTYPDKNYITWDPKNYPFQVPGSGGGTPFQVPVLHCEIEGQRAALVCGITAPVNFFTRAFCHIKIGPFPIGGILCSIANVVFWPVTLAYAAAVAAAWIAGSSDNRDFDNAGSLNHGEWVAIMGRWVYDAGHTGWNELHPVKSVHKLDPPGPNEDIKTFISRWCGLLGEVPFPGPGLHPTDGFTPPQTATWTAQLAPQNRWLFHPDVDGCTPEQPPLR